MKQKTIRERFGEKILKLRNIYGMSQMDLAHQLGYSSTGMISQIESGKRGMGIEKIDQVAKLFKIQPNFLFSEVEMKTDDLKLCIAFEAQLKLPPEKRHVHFEAIKSLLMLTANFKA